MTMNVIRAAYLLLLVVPALGCSGSSGEDGDTPLTRLAIGGRVVFPGAEAPPVPGTVVAAYYGLEAVEDYDRCRPAFLSSNGAFPENVESGAGWGIYADQLSDRPLVRALAFWTPRANDEVFRSPDYALGRIPLRVGDRFGETGMLVQSPCDPPDPSGAICFQGRFMEMIVLTGTVTEACRY